MPAIKPLSQTASKWKRVTSGAGTEYEEGVRSPRKDWAEETAKSEAAWSQGVQNAISNKTFGKGVRTAGTEKWQKNAIEKGPARFSQGVQLAEDAYQEGFAPYHQTIQSTTLPARGARGDVKNIQRVAVIAKALHDKKLQLKGGK